MKCVACVTGDMVPGTTTFTVERGPTTVVVRGVPALVCDTCGNDYVNEETMRQLENLVNNAVSSGASMVVHDFRVTC